ncbi:uncharacterized protein LOC114353010 isoform X3 [Ostrinia furnacalis]|uniref:uncharacterized protein LOC114353010 isoform X3 n=1 Tax=Ostrinia furnacalis TaxID=93504 RepID=UPI00103D4C39|nr:uncharacterized protein LOC114353010 isoform X3 [Ostrinia furnacalis]
MELKSPKAKKKSSFAKLVSWGKMFRAPILMLFLLGSTSCDDSDSSDELVPLVPKSNITNSNNFLNEPKWRHKHTHVLPNVNVSFSDKEVLSDIRYLRRRLNKKIVNFVMTDFLVDGEVENRIHFNGITAKETSVGADGLGLKLRQLTDGRHFVQVIYAPNGEVQDCEYITQGKSARNFLKTLRKELKLALDEEGYRLTQKKRSDDEEKFYRQFGNLTLRILRKGERLPPDVATWFNYDRLKMECLQRHEELAHMMENRNKISENSLARSRRSFRENFIVPGTKWCGAGQLAETYAELGDDHRNEDRCCRAHDNCRRNIGPFKKRFGYFNFRPYTVSHCRCDRRFRACLKLADTSVSNMVGKLFFNVVQTKCFVLKPVKICTKRSWWGRCLSRGYHKQAFLRDNLPY